VRARRAVAFRPAYAATAAWTIPAADGGPEHQRVANRHSGARAQERPAL